MKCTRYTISKVTHLTSLFSCLVKFLGSGPLAVAAEMLGVFFQLAAEVWQLATHCLGLQCLQSSQILYFACVLSSQTWFQKLWDHFLVQTRDGPSNIMRDGNLFALPNQWFGEIFGIWDTFGSSGVLLAKVHVLFHGATYPRNSGGVWCGEEELTSPAFECKWPSGPVQDADGKGLYYVQSKGCLSAHGHCILPAWLCRLMIETGAKGLGWKTLFHQEVISQ